MICKQFAREKAINVSIDTKKNKINVHDVIGGGIQVRNSLCYIWF